DLLEAVEHLRPEHLVPGLIGDELEHPDWLVHGVRKLAPKRQWVGHHLRQPHQEDGGADHAERLGAHALVKHTGSAHATSTAQSRREGLVFPVRIETVRSDTTTVTTGSCSRVLLYRPAIARSA